MALPGIGMVASREASTLVVSTRVLVAGVLVSSLGHMGRSHGHDSSRDRDRSRRRLHPGGNIGKHLGGFAMTEHVAAVENGQEEAEEAVGAVGERNSRS